MSGVWVFNNGVYRLESSPRRRVLEHLPSGEVVSSYSSLDRILRGLGWERYYGGDPDLYQFHKHSSIDLISLPKDFSKFGSVHMYDIVVKNPNVFHVRDMVSVTCLAWYWLHEAASAKANWKRIKRTGVRFMLLCTA
ncbi:hypothetical protein GQ457_07G043670 [Hibiscus cannabinus]